MRESLSVKADGLFILTHHRTRRLTGACKINCMWQNDKPLQYRSRANSSFLLHCQ